MMGKKSSQPKPAQAPAAPPADQTPLPRERVAQPADAAAQGAASEPLMGGASTLGATDDKKKGTLLY